MEKTKIFLWLMLLYSFTAKAETVINEIRYEGNKVTQVSVFNREIFIQPGDKFNEALIEKSRQSIMDLGLYKSVRYYLEENYIQGNAGKELYKVNVVFIVKEKYYNLVFPRLKVEDEDIFYGLQYKGDNLFGLNHRARILALDLGSTNGVNESRYSFIYLYPNVNNSFYNLDVALQTQNEVDESDGVIDRQDDSYRIGVTRWLNKKGRNRGWFTGGAVTYQTRVNEDLIVSENIESIDAIILGAQVGYRNINDFEYNRGGKSYGYKLDWTGDSIGSDAQYTRHQFYYQSYYRFENRPSTNLNVQMKFGHSNDKVLGEYAFSLGSSDDLRGYENNRFQGNTLFLTNFEYMFPHYKYPLLRYVTFVDIGNTYDQLDEVLHEPLNVGAGVGLRWKIKSLVKIDLRMDVAYGFTDEDYKFSFGTRHTF